MYCIRCGKQINDGVKYCMYCGSPTAEGRKAQAKPEQNTASIPPDFFSRRMNPKPEDDFTIPIPKDFIRSASEAAQEPDPAGDLDDTQMVSGADIRRAMEEMEDTGEDMAPAGLQDALEQVIEEKLHDAVPEDLPEMAEQQAEQVPQDIESPAYTRVITSEEAQEAAAKLFASAEAPQDIENRDYTRVISKEDIRAAQQELQEEAEADASAEQPEIDITEIPDIPIPSDFVEPEDQQQSQRVYPNPDAAYHRNRIRRSEELDQDDEEDGPEQLISMRGIMMVAVVVVLLFAIAVGAVVMSLRGGGSSDTGSAGSGISFSYGESDDG